MLDRAGLEDTTCECYELTTRQFGDFLRSSVELSANAAGRIASDGKPEREKPG
ncbi:MAG: hypothetical protein ACREM8_13105 [Vulcanimicrobiaceae bacterium]